MLLSRKWLRDFTDITASPEEYELKMTLAGSKVEKTINAGAEIKNVVLARVSAIERHPDSDHMWICQMDVGAAEPVQIVTGAQNVRAGDYVPAALHKSRLPGGVKIEKGKLRGVVSNGMLCSLEELKLDSRDFPQMEGVDGILIFSGDDITGYSPGDDICPIINADDSIVEFEITNNRPDCLSVIGLARESAAAFNAELRIGKPQARGGGGDINDYLEVVVKSSELCPRYTAKMVKNIKIAPSPKWMRERLRASGVRPVNNIVDITNYVMLEYGQPMHAFDYRCLTGKKIVVRNAEAGETLTTLDGTERRLSPDMLVIADSARAVGIAGIMGGENSEITDSTELVIFESASFNGVNIRRTGVALGMRTDASGRFEKGLDTEGTLPAVLRACELVELLDAGDALDGTIDIRAQEKSSAALRLQPKKINGLLGTDLSRDFMAETLQKLGFTISDDDTVTVPSWRSDVSHYSDLAEEVGRFYGYDKIIPTLFTATAQPGGYTERQRFDTRLGGVMRSYGFSEALTYSFIGKNDYDLISLPDASPKRDSLVILNPLGDERSLMRTTPLPGIIESLTRNRNARNENVRLYELAKVYIPRPNDLPDERVILTCGAYGDIDFFEIKGALEAVLAAARVPGVSFKSIPASETYHPGRFARVFSGCEELGSFGQLHPGVCEKAGLPEAFAAELDVELLFKLALQEPGFTRLPKFPGSARDLAVVCAVETESDIIVSRIKNAGSQILKSVHIFDVYEGAQLEPGKKSIALNLVFRSDARTLTDEEVDSDMALFVKALSEVGAFIR